MNELPVPDSALEALRYCHTSRWADSKDEVREIAAPVVAAVLREIAEDLETGAARMTTAESAYQRARASEALAIARGLHRHADKLDGGAE